MSSKEYIRYSNCHEDALILSNYIKKRGVALSIGSAGDNSLYLAKEGFKKIYIIDANICQIYLIKLKLKAIELLSLEEYKEFYGFKSGNPLKYYDKIKDSLDEDVRTYFDKHKKLIKKGLCYNGKFEKYLRLFGNFLLPLTNSKKTIKKFFDFSDIEEQKQFYVNVFANKKFKFLFKIFFSKKGLKQGRDESCFRYVESDTAAALYNRVSVGFKNVPNATNPYIILPGIGKFVNDLPYLEKSTFNDIKQNVNKFEFIHGDLSLIKDLDVKFDFCNLSDIFEYVSEEEVKKYEDLLSTKVNPSARVIFWNMVIPRYFNSKYFIPLDKEESLRTDRAFYYTNLFAYEFSEDIDND